MPPDTTAADTTTPEVLPEGSVPPVKDAKASDAEANFVEEIESEEAALESESSGEQPAAEPPLQEPPLFDTLLEALGDIPEEPNDTLLRSLTPRAIAALPDSAKGIIKHFIAAQRAEKAKAEKTVTDRQAAQDAREKELEDDAKALVRRQAEFAAVFKSDKFKEMIAKADETEEVDPMTPEGQVAIISREVAKHFKTFAEPVTQKANEIEKVAAYNAFVESNTKMQDASFKSKVASLIKERREAGAPIKLPDAFALVERQDLLDAENARRERERTARAKSNQRIQRTTASSDPSASSGPIPEHVKKNGYAGHKPGPVANYHFFKDHPKAKQAVLQRRG